MCPACFNIKYNKHCVDGVYFMWFEKSAVIISLTPIWPTILYKHVSCVLRTELFKCHLEEIRVSRS
jgi:hypothetical protein